MSENINGDSKAMVREFARLRALFVKLVNIEIEAKEELEKTIAWRVYDTARVERELAKIDLAVGEKKFKYNLCKMFLETGEKNYPGAQVVEKTEVEYNEKLILTWVMSRGMVEVLNLKVAPLKKAIKKLADTPSQLMINETPVARVFKIPAVKIDTDLSEFLGASDG